MVTEAVASPAAARHAPARSGFWSWVTTVDHKRIGALYLITTLFFFVTGGLMALAMRIQLEHVEQPGHLGRRLRPHLHDARDDDGVPVRRAGHGGVRELHGAAHDRRARHGLPTPERGVPVAPDPRRARHVHGLRLGRRRRRRGLDGLPAALGAVARARDRPLDRRPPHHHDQLGDRGHQLHLHDPQHARARACASRGCRSSSGPSTSTRSCCSSRCRCSQARSRCSCSTATTARPSTPPATTGRCSTSTCSGPSGTPRCTSSPCRGSG